MCVCVFVLPRSAGKLRVSHIRKSNASEQSTKRYSPNHSLAFLKVKKWNDRAARAAHKLMKFSAWNMNRKDEWKIHSRSRKEKGAKRARAPDRTKRQRNNDKINIRHKSHVIDWNWLDWNKFLFGWFLAARWHCFNRTIAGCRVHSTCSVVSNADRHPGTQTSTATKQ